MVVASPGHRFPLAIDMATSLEDTKKAAFANTFVVSRQDGAQLRFDGPEEAWRRRKRAHRKSRLGCLSCKRRKVKVTRPLSTRLLTTLEAREREG